MKAFCLLYRLQKHNVRGLVINSFDADFSYHSSKLVEHLCVDIFKKKNEHEKKLISIADAFFKVDIYKRGIKVSH
ncbi:MAG: hypothetical protein JST10_03400 [Bacteroidetes bacterium]|nr:hypothetical protein [Bacteroidota bacterium]